MAKRFACSFIVILVAVAALTAIWYPDAFATINRFIRNVLVWMLTLVVLVLAGIFLACCWCSVRRIEVESSDRTKKRQTEYAQIPSPYPETYKTHSISDFQYSSDLHLMRFGKRLPVVSPEKQYIVAKDYTVCFQLNGDKKSVTVPKGMLSDLTSVPRPFRGIVGRVGPHLEAAIVHDYLYMAWQLKPPHMTAREMSQMRRFSDDLMLTAMKAAGMGSKAHVIYVAVRLFGKCIFRKRAPDPLILSEDKLPKCDDGDTDTSSDNPDRQSVEA